MPRRATIEQKSLLSDLRNLPSKGHPRYSLGSKKTMALRQANSVSSTWTSVIGLTSSSMILLPILLMSRSGDILESDNTTTKWTQSRSLLMFVHICRGVCVCVCGCDPRLGRAAGWAVFVGFVIGRLVRS